MSISDGIEHFRALGTAPLGITPPKGSISHFAYNIQG
jgi:hypothetical protein